MPAYNAEKYIAEAVQSVIGQSFSDWELLIIDDGSKDETFKIAKDFESKDSRIKVFQNEKNEGIVYTRNKLIDLASADYIAWQDSDDVSLPHRLSEQVKILDNNADVAIVGGGLEFFEGDKTLSARMYQENDKDARKNIFKFSPLSQGASMYKKSAVIEVGKYDSDIDTAEDLNLTFKIAKKYKISNLTNIVLRYRQHAGSETFSRLRKMEIATLKVRLTHSMSTAYNPTFMDYVYNVAQFISIFFIPAKLKIWIFNKIRNK